MFSIWCAHAIPFAVPSTVADKSTCGVMNNVANFIAVFLANVTNQAALTPECTVTDPSCYSIECSSSDRSHYIVDIHPCTTPPTFQLALQRGSKSTFRRTYFANNRVIERFDGNTWFQVTMSYEVDLLVLEVAVNSTTQHVQHDLLYFTTDSFYAGACEVQWWYALIWPPSNTLCSYPSE